MPKNNWHIPTWKTLSGQQNHLMSQRQITYEIRHVVAVVSLSDPAFKKAFQKRNNEMPLSQHEPPLRIMACPNPK